MQDQSLKLMWKDKSLPDPAYRLPTVRFGMVSFLLRVRTRNRRFSSLLKFTRISKFV